MFIFLLWFLFLDYKDHLTQDEINLNGERKKVAAYSEDDAKC